MEFDIRPAESEDIGPLGRMNEQFIAEEGSRNPMSLAQLEQRMRGWLSEGWGLIVIELDGEIAGYMLFLERGDEYYPDQREIYVRHFYITPEHRGRSLGSGAFERIAEAHFPPGARVVLEVLETNPRGRQFWDRIGFRSYCTQMQRVSEP